MDRKCAKLGNRATKRERLAAHRAKLEMKQRDDFVEVHPHVFANISKNHEHYGDTPAEHEQRKNNS